MEVRVFLIGDIVGKPGREILAARLADYVRDNQVDFVIANGENVAQGSGITPNTYKEVARTGVDVVTLGDHTWRRKEVIQLLEKEPRVLRPHNYPPSCPGRGFDVFEMSNGMRIAILTMLGRIFMNPVDCPFRMADEVLSTIDPDVKLIIVEIHAEATSEKIALGWKLDGRVSCVFGTHTHVATADARVLPGGTAYITDLGMTGPFNSVIGRVKDSVLYRFETSMHAPFDVARGDPRLCGALLRLDSSTGRALGIERVELGKRS